MIQKKLDLAHKALKSKNFKEAKKLFEEALLINPNLPAVYNILGNIELNLGNANISINFLHISCVHILTDILYCLLLFNYTPTSGSFQRHVQSILISWSC